MKKSIAWILWTLCVILIIFSLVKMFIGTNSWVLYALIVGVGFYFTQKLFKNYLAH